MNTQHLLSRVERDLRISRICRIAWAVLLAGSLLATPALGAAVALGAQLVLLALMWLLVTSSSVRQTRLAMQWPAMISSGRFEEAEKQIRQCLRGFAPVGSLKVLCIHHLARIRLAQRKWSDAAALARAVLRYPARGLPGLSAATLQVLAEASMRLDDLPATAEALARLRSSKLTLELAIPLLHLETLYLARVQEWGQILSGIEDKVSLAELMPSESAATVEGLFAVACDHAGQASRRDFLRARCDLLADMPRLAASCPELTRLWPPAALPDGETRSC